MKAAASVYWIVVIEDSTQNKLLATGTLVIEKKFTHNAGRVRSISATRHVSLPLNQCFNVH